MAQVGKKKAQGNGEVLKRRESEVQTGRGSGGQGQPQVQAGWDSGGQGPAPGSGRLELW